MARDLVEQVLGLLQGAGSAGLLTADLAMQLNLGPRQRRGLERVLDKQIGRAHV